MNISRNLNRREFIHQSAVLAGGLAAGYTQGQAAPATELPAATSSRPITVADLPVGSAPRPVILPHFPSRLHAFIWKNWQLIAPEHLARVVGTTRANIVQLAQAMGLGHPPRITPDQQRRSYLTVIKHNWHLLPYDQLLMLLDWTPAQLAYTLREDDFLFVKLGNLKPQCEPMRWQPSDAAARQREQEIAQIVRDNFKDQISEPDEPLFSFVSDLSAPPRHRAQTVQGTRQLRLCYSYFALYGDPLLDTEADPYPDGYLARLAEAGVTGVWLQAVLSKLAVFPWQPDLSARFEERRKSLQRLASRARRHGLGVYLYLNEPRALPLSFFAAHPELKGAIEGDHAALCTSDPEVQKYLTDAIASICQAAPDLAGFFTITASENLSNCWSHGAGAGCPRCRRRTPAEVIAEVNRLIFDGIRRTGGNQRLVAWDWGWDDAWAEAAINLLPTGVSLMSVSEWSLPLERGGVPTQVGEYSMSAVGPGPRATRHWEVAQKRGLSTIAKIQAGNTWELSATPYLPALANVAQHAANLRRAGVKEIMLGWTLGGYPSPNLEVMAEMMNTADNPNRAPTVDEVLTRVAGRHFGSTFAPMAVRFWQAFSAAFREFPFHGSVVYNAPLQLGPANGLWAEPTGYPATMVGFPYDDLDAWRGPYPATVFIQQLEKVTQGIAQAIADIEKQSGLSGLDSNPSPTPKQSPEQRALRAEITLATVAMIHWQSVANQSRFVLERRALAKVPSAAEAQSHRQEIERLLKAELELARQLYTLQVRDSRIGFEASNQYYYVPLDLVEKVLNCRYLLDHWLPSLGTR